MLLLVRKMLPKKIEYNPFEGTINLLYVVPTVRAHGQRAAATGIKNITNRPCIASFSAKAGPCRRGPRRRLRECEDLVHGKRRKSLRARGAAGERETSKNLGEGKHTKSSAISPYECFSLGWLWSVTFRCVTAFACGFRECVDTATYTRALNKV